jgi:hypothetical protein
MISNPPSGITPFLSQLPRLALLTAEANELLCGRRELSTSDDKFSRTDAKKAAVNGALHSINAQQKRRHIGC